MGGHVWRKQRQMTTCRVAGGGAGVPLRSGSWQWGLLHPRARGPGGWAWKLDSSYLLGSKLWDSTESAQETPFKGRTLLATVGGTLITKKQKGLSTDSIHFLFLSKQGFFFSFLRGCVSWGNYYFLFAFDKNSANHFWVFSRNLWQGGWKAWGTLSHSVMSLSPRCLSIKGGMRGQGRYVPACRSPEDVSLCGSYQEKKERGEFELSQSSYLRDWAPQHFWVLGKARGAFPSYTCFQSGDSEKVACVSCKLLDKNCIDLYCIKTCGFHTYCCGHHRIFTLIRTSWEED